MTCSVLESVVAPKYPTGVASALMTSTEEGYDDEYNGDFWYGKEDARAQEVQMCPVSRTPTAMIK
jgi:hypothetical protein